MALFTALTRLGHAVELAEDGQEALAKFQDQKFDLIIADVKLNKLDGLTLIREIKKIKPEAQIIVLSSGGGVEEAVGLMREGARDYLMKTFPAQVLEEAIKRVFCDEPEAIEDIGGQKEKENEERPIIFKSPVMERLLGLALSLSSSSATVLLQGESGTGKELLARFIHRHSSRAEGPFVAVNCAGLPESLLESELFGHEKGAFTGALSKKPGKFDLAHGGTLLLDEISEMDISLQAKLLRALQEGEIDPVGGKGPHKIDVRVIATTNRKLKAWVDEGRFRADLYYRLNVMPFYIPALKERSEDTEVLANYFVEKHAAANNKSLDGLSEQALELIKAHDWPGNIRELENTVARAVLMARGDKVEAHDIFMDEAGFMAALERNAGPLTAACEEKPNVVEIEETNLPQEPFLEENATRLSSGLTLMTIEEMERCLIGQALRETSGNRTHAAKLLGISVRTLRNKLAEYRSEAPESVSALG
jgi:two-component system response regulator FlrC